MSGMIIPGSDPLVTPVHVRKTLTFLNSSGTVDVFTISGLVRGLYLTARCTTNVVEDGTVTSIELGGAADPDAFIVKANPSLLLAGLWWKDATPVAGPVQIEAIQKDWLTDEDIIATIIGGTDLDSGVIVFDVSYVPVTDGASLVAA